MADDRWQMTDKQAQPPFAFKAEDILPFEPNTLTLTEEQAKLWAIQPLQWEPQIGLGKDCFIRIGKDGELDFHLGEGMTITQAARVFMDWLDRMAHHRTLVLIAAHALVDAGCKPIGRFCTIELAEFERLAEAVRLERSDARGEEKPG